MTAAGTHQGVPDLRASATTLAGLTSALLGWRPAEFWAATPAELAAALAPFVPAAAPRPDADAIARLMKEHPDG